MSTPGRNKEHPELLGNNQSERLGTIGSLTNTLFVVGSEGRGMKDSIADLCTSTVSIPGGDAFVDSLNLSVAVGVILSNSSTIK